MVQTKVVWYNFTNSLCLQLTTKVVNLQNPTLVGRIFFLIAVALMYRLQKTIFRNKI